MIWREVVASNSPRPHLPVQMYLHVAGGCKTAWTRSRQPR
jgi:hypothetical protein